MVATVRYHVCQGWPAVDCAGGELVAGTDAEFDPQRAGPLLPDLRPDAPANIRRFNAYMEQHGRIVRLFGQALEVWMLSFGFTIVREINPASRRRRRPTRKL